MKTQRPEPLIYFRLSSKKNHARKTCQELSFKNHNFLRKKTTPLVAICSTSKPKSKTLRPPSTPLPITVDVDLHKVAEVGDVGEGQWLEPFCSEPEAESLQRQQLFIAIKRHSIRTKPQHPRPTPLRQTTTHSPPKKTRASLEPSAHHRRRRPSQSGRGRRRR